MYLAYARSIVEVDGETISNKFNFEEGPGTSKLYKAQKQTVGMLYAIAFAISVKLFESPDFWVWWQLRVGPFGGDGWDRLNETDSRDRTLIKRACFTCSGHRIDTYCEGRNFATCRSIVRWY